MTALFLSKPAVEFRKLNPTYENTTKFAEISLTPPHHKLWRFFITLKV